MLANLETRDTLMGSLPHGGIGAEVGVQWGDFAKSIIDQNAPARLFLIDCWCHQEPEVYGHDPANVSDYANLIYFWQVAARFTQHRNVHVLRMFSLDAAAMFSDAYFDWVYLDGNHLMAREDIKAWWPKVKPGGWLCGHDYCEVGDYITVKAAVDEYVAAHGLELFITGEPGYPAWATQKPIN